ncbi:hypothetical protein DL767_002811 [Monosporascus sp. MG133]|nr:hypothetical protein DL767_002811 [Monosporascus sp. MG133]
MADPNIIKQHPIGKGLDTFRASFDSVCDDHNLSHSPGALDQLGRDDIQNITLDLLSALRNFSAVRFLRSKTGHGILRSDLLRLISNVTSDDFDFDRVKPLLRVALANNPDNAIIWNHVYSAVSEATPPPRPIASSFQQTPWLHSTGGFANSSEYRQDGSTGERKMDIGFVTNPEAGMDFYC